jgi:hypothetical protein
MISGVAEEQDLLLDWIFAYDRGLIFQAFLHDALVKLPSSRFKTG